MLQTLLDGRALPAGLLASEAGVAASTASAHLARLVHGSLLVVEHHGRHRCYRLAGDWVAEALEKLAGLAPIAPVRSLRDDTRARALRRARTCYDHLAGELGVALMASLLRQGLLVGHDGSFRPETERLSTPSRHACYQLTNHGRDFVQELGVDIQAGSRRPLVRHCVDWSEQRHHLSGRLGAALAAHMFKAGWIVPGDIRRAVRVTNRGVEELHARFNLDINLSPETQATTAT
jgi:hypothetical protein